MIRQKELSTTAYIILEKKVCNEAQRWYEKTIQSNARYVVYVVRRCYMLALIMEHITGIKMKDSKEREFLTDSSFFLRCNELAAYYCKYKRFPEILLCDDILIHGRNINHFLKVLEERLCELLPMYEEWEIQAALAAAIKIYVYVRSEEPILLLGRYESCLKYERKEPPSFWRKVSSNISTLILRADMANACYIFSESIPSAVYQKIEKAKEWHKTVFQNTTQYTSISYGRENRLLKAIYTIRVVKAQRSDDYRAIPFVFLPNLDEKETDDIKSEVFHQLRKDTRWREIEEYIDVLSAINGKRLFNEWLTLLISQVLLHEFNQQYGITINTAGQEYIEERTKLLRNYNVYGEAWTEKMLDFTLTQNVLSIDDVDKILMKNITEHFIMKSDAFDDENECINEGLIRKRLENYFYENAIIEETSAYELSQISYVPTKRRSMRRVRGCGFTLAALNDGYTKSEMDYSMAYFLQMMDAGVLAISSYASRETKVVGFAQFAKAGEQSLQIYPLRLYEYMPLLIMIHRRCVLNRKDLKRELEKFFSSKYCKIESKNKAAILQWIEYMLSVGQTPHEWSGNYLMKIDLGDKGNEEDKIAILLQYMEKQEAHVNSYEEYTKEKIW